jgi:acyl transferase domain-containing protein/nucleoside-diphosphate-sugar epimerase
MKTDVTYLQEQIQRSLIAIRKLKEENTKLKENHGKEPIAVIGMSCKFPDENESIAAFWKSLSEGKDLISELPTDRWDTDKFYNSDTGNEGTYYTKYAGVLKRNLRAFDPVFFNISPLEAKYMDPQQRLLLEAAWEAIENANYAPGELQKSETGVFIGIASIDNAIRLHQSHAPISAYTGTGNTLSGSAGRIAHVFGLNGPVMSIDTACSSSLVALHQACQSIRNKECSAALVGGVNVLLSPDVMVNFCQSNMLAPDGRCKTFDESADGYSRGEGAGMVLLKPYGEALKAGDTILGLIKGSAINHDGRSAGLTVPNGHAQEAVIKKALKDANLTPDQVGFVECHGTGTALGDPIEFEAIANTYGNRNPDNVLRIGSLKTNIGHLEAAAGVAGLIKLLLCLQNKMLVPHLHFKQPNSHIPWDKFPQIKLTHNLEPWELQAPQKARVAGISSFGFTGTNAHVIVEEYVNNKENFAVNKEGYQILSLSAKNEDALNNLKSSYIEFLENTKEPLAAITYSSNIGREHFDFRLALSSNSKQELISGLKSANKSFKKRNEIPKVAFLFTGQGAQYKNMGIDLYRSNSFFKSKIDKCNTILKNELAISLLDLLFNPDYEEQIHQTEYAQPVIFAVEYALASLWKHWGVQPTVLLGHSIGELVAACFAGVFTLEDALKIVVARGRFMQHAPGHGMMYSTNLSGEQLLPYTSMYTNTSIAAYNSASQSVVSGAKEEVEHIVNTLREEGFLVKHLEVSHAFHSPLMEPAKVKFHEAIKNIKFNKPNVQILSNTNGKIVGDEIITPEYWSDQLTNSVHFTSCIEKLSTLNLDACIEVGPTPVLLPLIANTINNYPELIPSLNKNEKGVRTITKAITTLYTLGAEIAWKNVHQGVEQKKVLLPNYPFQRNEYWIDGEGFNVKKPDQPKTPSNVPKIYQADWKLQELESPLLDGINEKEWLLVEYVKDDALEFQYLLSSEFGIESTRVQLSISGQDLNPELVEILKNTNKAFNCIIFPKSKLPSIQVYKNDGVNFVAFVKQLNHFNKIEILHSLTILSQPEESTATNGIEVLAEVFGNEFGLSGINRVQLLTKLNKSILRTILHEINSNKKESLVCLSNEKRSVKHLKELSLPIIGDAPLFDKNKSYLVTGGTGALGRKLAVWAIKNEAKHLVLLSRSGQFDTEIIEFYRKSGVTLEIVKADISNKEQVERVIAKFGTEFPHLDGVFHLSGVLSDGLMVNQSNAKFQKVLAPKVEGSFILSEVTKKISMSFYVHFSSISSVLGTPGQSNYAYANAFMDLLSESRLQQGMPCLNINWGPWAGSGMANNLDDKSIQFIEKIKHDEGFEVLGSLLRGKYQGSYTVGSVHTSVATNLNIAVYTSENSQSTRENKVLPEEKTTLKNTACTVDAIHKIIADIIELPLNQLDTEVPIINYGFDSLLALKTQNKIRKDFGVNLDAGEFMKNPSINDLYEIVAKAQLHEANPVEEKTDLVDLSEKSLDNIDQLTEEEIDQLLKSLN